MQRERPTSRNVRAAGLALAGALLALPGAALANSTGPPDERTGAPEEMTCRISGCHVDELLNSGPGVLELILPPSYVPAETYTIDVRLSQTDQMRWGFELTVLDELGESVGSLAPTDDQTQVPPLPSILLGREYIKHTQLGTAAGQADGHAWSFTWTAPSEDVGPVTFYAAGNASDNNNLQIRTGTSGDFIYTAQGSVSVPEAGGLGGVVALAAAAGLARRRGRLCSSADPRGACGPVG